MAAVTTAGHRIRAVALGLAVARRLSTAAEGESKPLYRRLSALRGDPNGSVAATMNGWIKEGKSLSRQEAMVIVRQLRRHKAFKHALEVMDWMEKKGITKDDHAVRLDLISQINGVTAAKDYFSNLPEPEKNQKTYTVLLSSYCQKMMVDEALSIYKKMKELNLDCSTLVGNNLMTLYMKIGQPEEAVAKFQEMVAADVPPDRITYGLLINSYVALNDADSAERVIKEMKEGGQIAPDWTIYCSLASFYSSSGFLKKSEAVLKEAEKVMRPNNREAYEYLISLYAAAGNLAEIRRVWDLLKAAFPNTTNRSYLCMLSALRKLGDADGVAQCFQEWESTCVSFDVRLADVVVDTYLRNGKLKEACSLWQKVLEKGGHDYRMLELFVDFHLKRRELSSATVYLGHMKSRGWQPRPVKMIEFQKLYEELKGVDGAEEFYNALEEAKRHSYRSERNFVPLVSGNENQK